MSMIRLCVAILLLAAFGDLRASALPQLGRVKTKYYMIHSDLDDAMIADLGTRMDAMYAEYSRRLADFDLRADPRPIDVYLFDRKRDYTEFTGGRYLHTGGIFIAGKNQLCAYLEGQRDTLRRTLQHEAFHQFAFKAMGNNMPIWLNEGMAQLFEEAIWTGQGFMMNQVPPRRIRQLQDDVRNNRLLPVKTLITLSPERWAANLAADSTLGATQYNQTWAMVHYMAYGDGGRNGVKLVALLKALGQGRDADEAFRENFGQNLELFKAAFENHAMALEPTAEATLIDHHEVLADLFAQLSERGKQFNNIGEFRKLVEVMHYRLKYTRGMMSWTAEPAGYFRDAAGVAYGADQLYFDARRGGGSLPDLVFRHPAYRIGLRARFYKDGEKIGHEVLVEGAQGGATANLDR